MTFRKEKRNFFGGEEGEGEQHEKMKFCLWVGKFNQNPTATLTHTHTHEVVRCGGESWKVLSLIKTGPGDDELLKNVDVKRWFVVRVGDSLMRFVARFGCWRGDGKPSSSAVRLKVVGWNLIECSPRNVMSIAERWRPNQWTAFLLRFRFYSRFFCDHTSRGSEELEESWLSPIQVIDFRLDPRLGWPASVADLDFFQALCLLDLTAQHAAGNTLRRQQENENCQNDFHCWLAELRRKKNF